MNREIRLASIRFQGGVFELTSQLLVSYELKYLKEKSILDELIKDCGNIIEELNSINKTLEKKLSLGLSLSLIGCLL